MAGKPFQGRYSPGADPATTTGPGPQAAPSRPVPNRPAPGPGLRARLLYLAALPMLIAGVAEIVQGDAGGMIVELGAFALLLAGAVLVGEGERAAAAFAARQVAKPPAVPRKLLGAGALGAGLFVGGAFGWGLGLLPGLGFGAVGAAATLLGFGLDPMRAKGMDRAGAFDSARAAEAVDRAEALVREIVAAAKGLRDRALEARVERFAQAAREVFRAVEADPRDLDRARKLLGVYLTGARDATVKFAALQARSPDPHARAGYEALLGDLETSFARHRAEFMADDRGELDIEIEVLRKRLKQEGLA